MRDTLSGNGPGDCSPALPLQLPQPGWERLYLGYSKVVVGAQPVIVTIRDNRDHIRAYIWVVMESHMEKKMEHEMETLLGLFWGYIGKSVLTRGARSHAVWGLQRRVPHVPRGTCATSAQNERNNGRKVSLESSTWCSVIFSRLAPCVLTCKPCKMTTSPSQEARSLCQISIGSWGIIL